MRQRSASFQRRLRPPLSAAAFLVAVVFLVLVSNGRPIGAGDTRPTERVAASLVGERDFDLDEYPEVTAPFAREAGDHKLSIYPVLSAVMAAPIFAIAGSFFALDETGTALAGKLAAALFSSLAAGLLFLAIGRRHSAGQASLAAAVFALGTSVWSTSQALWQHPAAVLFLCLALLMMVRIDDEPEWAARAGLPLGLAVAARHADVALVAVLWVSLAARYPRRIAALVAWSLPGAVLAAAYHWLYFGSPLATGFEGSLSQRFSEPWGVGQLGLLVSPAKGLLWFTPVAIVAVAGLIRALRLGDRWLATTLGLGALAHLVLIGRWSEWHGGDSFGPRMLTDALPLLFLFLPEGLELFGGWGRALAGLSIGAQMLGAFSYDYRWERLFWRDAENRHAALWDVVNSPIPFHSREGVAILAAPAVVEGRAIVRRHPIVPLGPTGAEVAFVGDRLVVGGTPESLGDIHMQRRARVVGDGLRLEGRWAGLFMRVRSGARVSRQELLIEGRGCGTLYVGESTFWSARPRWSEYRMNGSFSIRHRYNYPESGGADVVVTVGRGGGEATLSRVSLKPS